MQMQDYLPFFQNLFAEYYRFTLENPAYAACLAIVVWLLTTIFYSIRIGFLNRRNSNMLKARLDAENALIAAQQENQQLQEEIAAGKEQIEEQVQRSAELQERITVLAGQMSDSIVAIASEPDLGQQGLSVSPSLEAEHLWQRYSAAVKQLGESLIMQRKSNIELQQTVDAETAKLAEKDSQLQVMQTRLDSQRQQVAKLELTIEEQNNQLAQQQESEKQRLAEIEAKHQADLAKLAALQQQAEDSANSRQQPVQPQETPRAPEVVAVVQPEPVRPAEIMPAPVQLPAVEPKPQPVKVEPKPAVAEVAASEPTIARAETAKQKQPAEKTDQGSPAGVGKFKSLFAGAKQQIEKLDDMFGLKTPMLPPEEPKQTMRGYREPEPVAPAPETVSEPEVAASVEKPSERAAKEAGAKASGRFKSLFTSSKARETGAAAAKEEPAETVAAEPAPEPQESRVAEPAGTETGSDTGKSKFKNIFGKLKRNV